jgi:hypothetical protein
MTLAMTTAMAVLGVTEAEEPAPPRPRVVVPFPRSGYAEVPAQPEAPARSAAPAGSAAAAHAAGAAARSAAPAHAAARARAAKPVHPAGRGRPAVPARSAALASPAVLAGPATLARSAAPASPAAAARPAAPARPGVSGRPGERPGSPGPVRLTRRGRLVVGGLAIAAAAALASLLSLVLAGGALAANHGAARAGYQGMQQIVVQPGQTLWSIAAAAEPSADPRTVMPQIMEANSLSGSTVYSGETLWVPGH